MTYSSQNNANFTPFADWAKDKQFNFQNKLIPDFFGEFKTWFAESIDEKFKLELVVKTSFTDDPDVVDAFYKLTGTKKKKDDERAKSLFISELCIKSPTRIDQPVHQILISQRDGDKVLVSYGNHIYNASRWKEDCVVYENDQEVAEDFIKFVSEKGVVFESKNQTKQDSFYALLSPYLVNYYDKAMA